VAGQRWAMSVGSISLLVCLGVLVVVAPEIALAVPGLLVLVWTAYKRPSLVILALILWLPFEGWALKFIPGSSILLVVPDVASLLLGVAAALRLLMNGYDEAERRFLARIAGPPAALLLIVLISWVINRPPMIDALYWVRVYLRFVPLALSLANRKTRDTVLRLLPSVAIVVVLSQSLIGLMEYLGGPSVAAFFWTGQYALGGVASQVDTLPTVGNRLVAGTLGHYNAYGMTLTLWLGVLLGVVSESSGSSQARLRRITALTVAFGSLMVVLSQSRQAAVILLLLYFIWLLGAGQAFSRWKFAGVAAGLTGILLGALNASAGIEGLISRFGRFGDAWFWTVEVAKNRGYVITSVMSAVLESAPLFGLGPGSFGSSYGSAIGPSGVSALGLDALGASFVGDVGWIAVFSQVGALGVAVVIWIGSRIFTGLRGPVVSCVTRYGGIAALLLLAVGMLASSPLTYKGPSSAFWVLAGLALTVPSGSTEHGGRLGPGVRSAPTPVRAGRTRAASLSDERDSTRMETESTWKLS